MHGTPCNHSPTCSQSIVFGYRATESAEKVRHTTTQQPHQHTITYKQLHKMTSWNKQGWANENIIILYTRLYTVLGYAANYTHGKKPLTHKNPLRKNCERGKARKEK